MMRFRVQLKRNCEQKPSPREIHVTIGRKSPNDDAWQRNHADLWFPRLAASKELLQWYREDGERHEFWRRYSLELDSRQAECERLRALAGDVPLTLLHNGSDEEYQVAIGLAKHIEHLECKHRWKAGWIIGGHTAPLRNEIEGMGGLWFAWHRAWMMPDRETWEYILSLMPGDF